MRLLRLAKANPRNDGVKRYEEAMMELIKPINKNDGKKKAPEMEAFLIS
jgi:hypothetical protein